MKRIVTSVLFLLLLSLSAFAQQYPLPTPVGTTPQVCSSCFPPYKNLPTSQFSPPIKALAGRYLDSSQNRDVQYPYRTIRARTIRVLPEKDRIYMHIGSTFAAYKLSTFFGKLPGGLQNFESGRAVDDRVVRWDGGVYPERDSGWHAPSMDGQDRLFGFDWDDRGNVYLAYGPWGFGIVTDSLPYFPLVKQVTDITADGRVGIIAVKVGAQYFAVIPSLTDMVVYDVTTTSNPTRIRTLNRVIESFSKVSTPGGDFIAVASGGTFSIYTGDAFVNGGAPLATASGVSSVVTDDGENFYVWRSGQIVVFSPTGSTYQQTAAHTLDFSFTAYSLTYGSGYLVVTGADPDARLNLHLLKVNSSSVERIDIGNYFRKFYTEATLDAQGKPVTAIPDQGYVRPIMGTVYRDGAKDYLLFAANGLGDVYEITGKVSVDARLTDGVWGTPNPYSPTSAQGPYWGDRLQFTTSYAGPGPIQISWDHDNPEAGIRNADVSVTGQGHVYQFGGVPTASGPAVITRPRKVKATAIGDAENSATVTVSMLAPTARLGLLNTNLLFTQPSASSTAPIVFGDQWVDASDGSLESHFASFNLDSVPVNANGGGSLDVGTCGAHTLSFGALYGPYLAGPVPVDSVQYQASLGPITYEVRPFVASFGATNPSPGLLKFDSSVRFSPAALPAAGATAATFDWKVVDAAGTPLPNFTPRSFTGTLAGNDSYTVPLPPTGSKVVLTVTVADAAISPNAAGCATGFSSSTRELVVKIPDPVVAKAGCANEGAPCTFTASSATNDTIGWTYQWYVDGAAMPGATAATYAAALAQGTHQVKVKITNAAGLSNESAIETVNVGPSLCSPHLSTMQVSVTPSCTSNCAVNTDIKFNVMAWGGSFQNCDTFKWEFGDGTPPVTGVFEPKHKYAANNTYAWTLTISNGVDTPVTQTGTIRVGSSTPPPPPPPPPTCDPPPTNTLGAEWTGQTSGCTRVNGVSCQAGETVAFSVNSMFNSRCTNESFSWVFGDGTFGAGRAVNKVYTVGGTLNGSITVTTSGGSASQAFQIAVTGGSQPPPPGCQPPASTGYLMMSYTGSLSGCTGPTGASTCAANEPITFKAELWNKAFQDCDTLEWDFNDGSAKKTGATVTHTFTNPLKTDFLITLTQKNAGGSRDITGLLRIAATNVKKPDAADFTISSTNPIIGVPITFTGSATGGDAVTNWAWTFGDGTTDSGQTVQKTFNTPGEWTVDLVAGNAGGAAPTVRKTITVRAANSFAFLLPVVTHGIGSNDSLWRTDLQIFSDVANVGPVELDLEFRSVTRTLRKTYVMDTSSVTMTDFLQYFSEGDLELSDAGVVIVRGTATKAPRIWTRTYNVAKTGVGTFGQLIPAIPIDGTQNLGSPANYYLTGLKKTQLYRTNLGLLNLTSAPITVNVKAFDGEGIARGEKSYTLNSFNLQQAPNIGGEFTALPDESTFSVVIDGARDGALVAYGSVIDNRTNDPVYIPAISAQPMRDEAMKHQIVPGVGHFGAWRSDFTVFNPDENLVVFDLSFFNGAGEKVSEAKNQILGGRQLLQLDDVLTNSRMTPPVVGDAIGIMKVDVTSLATNYPVVTDRTYNKQDAGTFGQGIGSFASSKPNVLPGKPAVLPAVRSDAAYYTNVGLVNVGLEPATVFITLLDKMTGQPVGSWTPPGGPLAPGASITATNLLRSFNETVDTGSLKIETSNGAVWAYASVIDQLTKDPEYVPAVPLN